jgi:hypothetical protein
MRIELHLAANAERDEVWINHPKEGQNLWGLGKITKEILKDLHLATDKVKDAIWACTQRLNHLLALAQEFVDEEERFNREIAARPTSWFARKPVVRPARNPFVTSGRTFSLAPRPKKSTTTRDLRKAAK